MAPTRKRNSALSAHHLTESQRAMAASLGLVLPSESEGRALGLILVPQYASGGLRLRGLVAERPRVMPRTARGQPTEYPELRALLDKMDEKDYLAWPLEQPQLNVPWAEKRGKKMHPALHFVRCYSDYWKKRFKAFQDGSTLYVIRLPDA